MRCLVHTDKAQQLNFRVFISLHDPVGDTMMIYVLVCQARQGYRQVFVSILVTRRVLSCSVCMILESLIPL